MLQTANYILAVANAPTLESAETTTASAGVYVALGLLVGAIVSYWWKNAIGGGKPPKYERDFFDAIVNDVAKWLSDSNLMEREQAETELRKELNGETSAALRQRHFSLNCRFVRTGPSTCDRVLVATIQTEGSEFKQVTIERSIEWCFTPSAIRKEFIRNNKSELDYDMLKLKAKQ